MSEPGDEVVRRASPRPLGGTAALVAAYVALVALGAVLGAWGSFLVPVRLPAGLPGLAVVFAVVGNLAAGLLGGLGTRTRLGAVMPGLGWVVVALLAGTKRPEGDLVIVSSLPADRFIGSVGVLFLLLGAVASAVAVGVGAGPRPVDQPPR